MRMKNFLHLRNVAFVLLLTCTLSLRAEYTTDQPYVELTRVSSSADNMWYMWLETDEADRGDLWIDWNNNNQYDKGEECPSSEYESGKVDALTIRIYGKLKLLSCNEDSITSVDLSHCTSIEKFYCTNNLIETLDVSMLPNLVEFCCNGNRLTSIDVSKNPNLEIFNCSSNDLSVVDVSNNLSLKELDCFETSITTIDVSKNTLLEDCFVYNTKITTIDVSQNPNLKTLAIVGNKIKELDISKNTQLVGLDCSKTLISHIDLSHNTNLSQLICTELELEQLDISNNTMLTSLNCSNNRLSSLDLSKHAKLEFVNVTNNDLTSLDVSAATELYDFYIYDNNISETAMGEMMNALADWSSIMYGGYLFVINTTSSREQNVCNKQQVAVAKAKNWSVFDYQDGANYGFNEYEGTDPSALNTILKDQTSVSMRGNNLHITVDPQIFGTSMRIFNMSGMLILSQKLTQTDTVVDMSSYPRGTYLVVIDNQTFRIMR